MVVGVMAGDMGFTLKNESRFFCSSGRRPTPMWTDGPLLALAVCPCGTRMSMPAALDRTTGSVGAASIAAPATATSHVAFIARAPRLHAWCLHVERSGVFQLRCRASRALLASDRPLSRRLAPAHGLRRRTSAPRPLACLALRLNPMLLSHDDGGASIWLWCRAQRALLAPGRRRPAPRPLESAPRAHGPRVPPTRSCRTCAVCPCVCGYNTMSVIHGLRTA